MCAAQPPTLASVRSHIQPDGLGRRCAALNHDLLGGMLPQPVHGPHVGEPAKGSLPPFSSQRIAQVVSLATFSISARDESIRLKPTEGFWHFRRVERGKDVFGLGPTRRFDVSAKDGHRTPTANSVTELSLRCRTRRKQHQKRIFHAHHPYLKHHFKAPVLTPRTQ
jgi:hypothetical protein